MTHTKKKYQLCVVTLNTRTGQRERRSFQCDGHGRVDVSSFEQILSMGAYLYGRGWDHSEFSVEKLTLDSHEVLDVKYGKR